MTVGRTLQKVAFYKSRAAKAEAYTNNGLPVSISNIGQTLDYIISSIFPNAKDAVATENDLPSSGNELNDYRIAINYNSTGQSAGFRWTQLEGQASPQWNLVQVFDSQDSILQKWETDASGIYVVQLGVEDVSGQTIHGSTLANGELTLSPNSGDGTNDPSLQTGYINLFGDTRPKDDDAYTLGTSTERFLSLYISDSGVISDGTNSVSVADLQNAVSHALVTSGNPHSVAYGELLNRLGNLELSGDITTETVDLSSGGNKSVTITITDDSHSHTVATISDFNDATWTLLKARLIDSANVQYSFDDVDKEVTAVVAVDTGDIDDIASPAVNKILASTSDGLNWEAVDGNVELTGHVSGSASYDSSNQKTEINTTIENTPLSSVDRINLENLAFSSSVGNPTNINLSSHGLQSGRKIRVLGSSQFDGEYTITKVDDNNFTIPVDTSAGAIDSGYIIPDGSQLLYDSLNDEYCVKLENAQLQHFEIGLLGGDDHPQYHNINGRSDETLNKVTGGSLAGSDLYLRSNPTATRGNILLEDTTCPETSAVYSGGNWEGTDLGSTGKPFRDIHLRGRIRGGRVEDVASLPIATIQEKGRVVQLPSGSIWFNKDGIQYKQLMEMPDLTGRSGSALVVNDAETGFDFTEVKVLSSDSLAGEQENIGATAVTVAAPANAIGIYVQWDEANTGTGRFAWGTSPLTPSIGIELLQGESRYFDCTSNLKVVSSGGSNDKLSYTWAIK